MVDPVTTQVASSVSTGGPSPSASPAGPGQVSSGDSAAFQEAVHRPEEFSAPQSGSVQAPQDVSAAKSPLASGMDRLSADMRSLKVDLDHGLANVKGEMGELISLQFKAMQITTSMTVMGQGGQKTGQGIQQLIKGQ